MSLKTETNKSCVALKCVILKGAAYERGLACFNYITAEDIGKQIPYIRVSLS